MGTCCWMTKKVDNDDRREKGRKRLDKKSTKSQNTIVYDKTRDEDMALNQRDVELFSFYIGMKRCDQLIRQFVMSGNSLNQQGQNNRVRQKQVSENQSKRQIYVLELSKIHVYLNVLQKFISSRFYQSMKKILLEVQTIDRKQQQTEREQFTYYELLQQSIQQFYRQEISKLLIVKDQDKKIITRMVKDLVDIVVVVIMSYLCLRIRRDQSINQQQGQQIRQRFNKVNHDRLDKLLKVMSQQQQQQQQTTAVDDTSNNKHESLYKSISLINKTQHIIIGNMFLIKMKLNFFYYYNPQVEKHKSKQMTHLRIKLVNSSLDDKNKQTQTKRQRQKQTQRQNNQLIIATYPITKTVIQKNINNQNDNNNNIPYQVTKDQGEYITYNSFSLQFTNNTFSLQFIAIPNTIIKFQTYPQQHVCSLSVNEFLNKLYTINQTFSLIKIQGNKQKNNNNHMIKQKVIVRENKDKDKMIERENNRNSLNQNLLPPSSSQVNNYQNQQSIQYTTQFRPNKLSLTIQPIPISFNLYYQRLKTYTKSVSKTIQAIANNTPLPLDYRSSIASNTSYQQSFAFSRSDTDKKSSCFGC